MCNIEEETLCLCVGARQLESARRQCREQQVEALSRAQVAADQTAAKVCTPAPCAGGLAAKLHISHHRFSHLFPSQLPVNVICAGEHARMHPHPRQSLATLSNGGCFQQLLHCCSCFDSLYLLKLSWPNSPSPCDYM